MLEESSYKIMFGNAPFPIAVFQSRGDEFASSRSVYQNPEWTKAFPFKLNAPVQELLIYLTGSSSESQGIIEKLKEKNNFYKKVFNLRESREYLINIWFIENNLFVLGVQPLIVDQSTLNTIISPHRWEALLNLLPDLIFVLDADCRFIDVYTNSFAELIAPPEAFLGKTCEEVLPPHIAALTKENVAKVMANKEIASAEYSLLLNEVTQYYEVRYIYVPDNEVMAVVRNITTTKRAEAQAQMAINMQEKIFRMALEHIHIEPGDLENRLFSMISSIGNDLFADKAFVFINQSVVNPNVTVVKWNIDAEEEDLIKVFNTILEDFKLKYTKASSDIKIVEILADNVSTGPIKDSLNRLNISSLMVVPIHDSIGVLGIIGIASTIPARVWKVYEKDMIILLARLVENVIKHHNIFTQLFESEQKYKRLQELFRSIADNMEDMLWAKNINKQFIFVNKAICEKLLNARDIDEPLGKTDLFFAERERAAHPEDPQYHTFGEICRDSDQVIIDTGKPGRFDEFGNVKGKFLFLDVIKTPLYDENGNMIAVVGAARDVTHEKRLETMRSLQFEILEAASRLEGLKDFLSFVIQRMSEFFKSHNIFIARVDFDKQLFHELDALDEKDQIDSWPISGSLSGYLLQYGKSLLLTRHEIQALSNQGKIQLIGTPAAVWMGSVLEVENQKLGVVVIQDYNEEDRFTEDDMKLLEALARILGLVIFRKEQQLKLQDAYEKLKESDLLKERLLQNMSHELRTPLNGIMGFSSLLADGHVEPHLMKKYAQDIYESGARLLNLISDLLDLTAFETQEIPLEFSVFSVHELLTALLEEFDQPARKKNLQLKADFKAHPDVSIETDYEKLRRILWNLISNAIKFTQHGYVSVDYNVYEDKVVFRIQDTGVGVAPDQKEKIFDKFYQTDMSISRGFEGAGLGLSLVKVLSEKLGANVIVDSQHGKGSVFELLLPVKSVETSESASHPDMTEMRTQRALQRILIVEDDQMNQDYLRIYFESKGFLVECKSQGAEALDFFTHHSDFGLVIMDIKLPEIDGYTLTQRFKEMNPAVPIAVVTAYATDRDRQRAIESGANLFLAKPLRVKDLDDLLQKLHL